ncbi:MAG: OmpA family protein [Phycisphaerales bacterium]
MTTGYGKAWRALGVLAVSGALLGGCANQQAMDDLRDSNRSLTDRNLVLQRGLQEAQNEIALLQRENTALDSAVAEYQKQITDARGNLAAREAAYQDFVKKFSALELGPLDADTSAALARLAAENPDLIKFDPNLGMLRFASDLTFDSGQDAVKEGAKAGLTALAKILTSSNASSYEVMIIGHTDSQPVSAATRDRGHQSNLHLSAHRAIAVKNTLTGLGLPRERVLVAGWGDARPAVPNTSSGNTPANRRVEVFLTRASMGAEAAAPAEQPPIGAATPRPVDVTK